MTENEVNEKVQYWLKKQGYKYKGILNARSGKQATKSNAEHDVGYGQIPVPLPNGSREILIDHQGVSDRPIDLIWVEAKGENDSMSELLQGFVRVLCAVYYGGGKGLLAVPTNEFDKLVVLSPFLTQVARAAERQMGLLDVESGQIEWLC